MKKIFFLVFIFPFICFGSDQYWTFLFSSVTVPQAESFKTKFKQLDKSGSTIQLFEYDAKTGMLGIHIGGSNLAPLKTEVRALSLSELGRLPTVDAASEADEKVTTDTDSP